jgi:hypothetical protein
MGQLSNPTSVRFRQLHDFLAHPVNRPAAQLPLKQRQIHHRLSRADLDELLDAYKASDSINGLAEHFGIHRTTVCAIAKRAGLKRRNPALDPAEAIRAAKLYQSGLSLKVIGQQYGIHATTVRSWLLRSGVTMRDPQGRER